jgi:hypothetical protein
MDQEYSKEILLENPQLYKKGLKGKDFSVWIYFQWCAYGCVQSCCIVLASFLCMSMVPDIFNGQLPDLWAIGALIYGGVVFNVNNKLL